MVDVLVSDERDISETISYAHMTVREFVDTYGFPSVINKINHKLTFCRLKGDATIHGRSITFHYDVESIGIKNGKFYIEVKASDWEDAESEVIALRKNGRRAWVLDSYDKPRIRVYLDESDIIKFNNMSDEDEDEF